MSDAIRELSAGEAYRRVVERGEPPEAVAADAGVAPATVHRAVARGYERDGNGTDPDVAAGDGSRARAGDGIDAAVEDATASSLCALGSTIDAPCEAVVDALADALAVLAPDGSVEYANGTASRALGDASEGNVLVGLREGFGASPAAVDVFAERLRAVATGEREEARFEIDGPGGDRRFEHRMSRLPGTTPSRVVVVVREVTEHRTREHRLRERRDELKRLERVSAAISGVLAALSDARTVDGIEQTVCERLVDTELYDVAYVGRGSAATGIEEVTAAADAPEGLEAAIVENGDRDGYDPVGAAFETGEVQVVEDLAEESVAEGVAETSGQFGHRSGAVVPLGREAPDRVLGVAARRPNGFSERERDAFENLRDVAALALAAVRHRSLLVADTTRELEFRVPAAGTWLERLPEGCTWRFDGAVVAGDDRVLHYATFEGASASTIREVYTEQAPVEDVSVEETDAGVGAMVVATGSTAGRLVALGGQIREAVFDGDALRIVHETPPDVAPERVLETLRASYPDAELVAKRVHRGGVEAGDGAPDLTDRQLAALRTAHLEGYYEWPRETTAEGIADALGIAAPTLLRHLRLAHGRLVRRLVDEDGRRPAGDI